MVSTQNLEKFYGTRIENDIRKIYPNLCTEIWIKEINNSLRVHVRDVRHFPIDPELLLNTIAKSWKGEPRQVTYDKDWFTATYWTNK